MRRILISFLTLWLFFPIDAWAESQDRASLEDDFSTEEIYSANDTIITVIVENDLFGSKGTDENYTSGVRLTYFDIHADLPRYAYDLDRYIPTFDINETTSVYYSLGQNLYTPSDITQRNQIPGERPWAAHLYGSMALVTLNDNHIDDVELSLGVVGPLAFGEHVQKFVHTHISKASATPRGWSNQLDNEPTIGLGWTRRYPSFSHLDFLGGLSAGITPHYGLTLGNVHSFANAGVNVRLAPESEKWQDAPARVRPALPGTGFFEIPKGKKWSWYLFAGLEGRAIVRNMFLDGNTFRDSYSVDKKHIVADANTGLALTYDKYRLSYTFVYRTREFDGQDDPAIFGAISLGYRF